jgi:predicted TIM-barrel fold metal-dependent hydrolase
MSAPTVASEQKTKIWANSGDSHYLEPDDLWYDLLPKELADRMPRAEKISETEEIIHIDGNSFRRELPSANKGIIKGEVRGEMVEGSLNEISHRPPGARDPIARLKDLNDEGIWGEVIYPSVGIWDFGIRSADLVREAFRAINEWRLEHVQKVAPDRFVLVASVPLINVEDAVAEVYRIKESGYYAVGLPCDPPGDTDDFNSDYWEPLWSAIEETGLVASVHLGTEKGGTRLYRGNGKAVLNYVETCYGPQRFLTKVVAGGALDRHPNLRVLLSEAGASWVPFIGDRMNEGYRQHGLFARPKLSMLPKEIIYRQVYATFQHDVSAVDAAKSGYHNVMWGSDYPHLEGTFGHTQETLHELFDDCDPALQHRITQGAFQELFPHIAPPPAA